MKPPSWPVIVVAGALALLALGLFRLGMIPSQQVTDAEEIAVARVLGGDGVRAV